ncbi:MAG: glycosyltransferase family 2 protein [Chitinophagales bacterium]|nr:glycosyltransferase family 2 protein [Chitinophagales bacterium]
MISIILPIYNEAESIPELFQEIEKALKTFDYEIVAVNDGSKDHSFQIIKEYTTKDRHIKLINFKYNSGQTAAINAGIQHASGDIIVFMDSDLENLPSDIPAMIDKLNEGYDVVSGWRRDRWQGQFLTRKLPSLLANKLISKISGVKLNDYGCTLKVYRSDVIKDVKLYGQMHRFIPVYCKWQGGKVAELPVQYQPRKYGASNYGIGRTFKVLLDLIVIKFLDRYMQRPIHFFGGFGFFSMLLSIISFLLALYFKLSGQKDFVQTPLPTFTAMFFVVGLVMILMGVLAEMLMRTYYESQNKFPFIIKEKINFD